MPNATDMSDSLTPVFETPSVNYADPLSNSNNIVVPVDTTPTSNDQLTAIALALGAYGFTTTLVNGGVKAVKTNANTATADDGTIFQLNNNGGFLTLNEIGTLNPYSDIATTDTTSIISDDSDSADYNIRYSSLDAKFYREDGSDIAFIRIVKNNTTKDIVFPNFTQAPAPGITNNKFKQFILMQMTIPHQERMQIVETNKDYQVLFYGKKPEIMQISGILKNTIDNPWSMNMIILWDSLMRGTALVEQGNICQLFADGELFEGYPFSFNRTKAAGNDNVTGFAFGFLIKTRIMVNQYEGPSDSVIPAAVTQSTYKDSANAASYGSSN